MKEQALNYLINLIPKYEQTIRTNNYRIPTYHCRKDSFKHSFFPSTLKGWFSLDDSIRNTETISIVKNRLLSFVHPVQNNIFNIFNSVELKFLSRLRLGFSHLNEHRFRHIFQDCMNPLCYCGLEIEDTLHYLLHSHHFNHICIDLMNSVNLFVITLSPCLTKIKKIYFYVVTHVQAESKINLFQKQF